MDQEATWMASQNSEISLAKERYEYFMRPEPRDNMSEIRLIDDPWLGPQAKMREVRIGMVRNAKDEDKHVVECWLEPFPHIRIDSAKPLQGWYQSKNNIDEDGNAHRPRPCFTEAILTEPYGGYCAVGCQFCYINSGFRGYRGTGMISVPLNYGEQVAKQLKKMNRSAAGYFSSFTDPFTPLEDYYHNTERAAQEFVKLGIPIFFLSRLRYPDWAIGLMQNSKYSYAQKSINTCDAEDWRKLSPGALSLEEHLDDIRRLKKAGIYVSIQCNPVVAGITSHEQILRLFKMLKQAGADHVIVKFVEAGYSWAPAMVERMKKVFGHERGVEFEKLFTENIGGQRTIAEKYRIIGHKLYSTAAKHLGLTYATCYEYKYERNADGTIKGKTGVSIGREYTTADQCHGQAVPLFTRNGPDEMFKPVDECPPSGCLYCADENNGQPRCGDLLAGEANSLQFKDFKQPIGLGVPKRPDLIQLQDFRNAQDH